MVNYRSGVFSIHTFRDVVTSRKYTFHCTNPSQMGECVHVKLLFSFEQLSYILVMHHFRVAYIDFSDDLAFGRALKEDGCKIAGFKMFVTAIFYRGSCIVYPSGKEFGD
jgi:hypothetical protein